MKRQKVTRKTKQEQNVEYRKLVLLEIGQLLYEYEGGITMDHLALEHHPIPVLQSCAYALRAARLAEVFSGKLRFTEEGRDRYQKNIVDKRDNETKGATGETNDGPQLG